MKLWAVTEQTREWKLYKEMREPAGEVWAIALSANGQFLAATTQDGRINVWDVAGDEAVSKIREYETAGAGKGRFGTSIDLSSDGKYTASGHENGAVYVFDNDSGRLRYSLSGMCTIHPFQH